MSSQHVLIIGAGVCGLAIAHGLQQANIPFTIFESEEETTFRPREWTMALHWGLPMLEELLPSHLADRLQHDAVPDPSLNYSEYPNNATAVYDGPSGKKIRDITSDGKFLRVSRRKLRALCGEGVDVQVKLSAPIQPPALTIG
jgi:2-polyprenyl-6-methoxyphenol hydroxylase-like FAD-dependent oxidoreductase